MTEYPMLNNVDIKRVDVVGGKLAILEEIIKRHPTGNVPEIYDIFLDKTPSVSGLSLDDEIYRTSSFLDVLGGFGLHDSFSGVNSLSYSMVWEKIFDQAKTNPRLGLFAESLGLEYREPVVFSQEQGKPEYWVKVMHHPNKENIFIVSYSLAPSFECKDGLSDLKDIKYEFRDLKICFYDVNKFEIVPDQLERFGEEYEIDNKIVEGSVQEMMILDNLGLVSDGWCSIGEFGAIENGVEIYQYTPIRKRIENVTSLSDSKVILGKGDYNIPFYRIPTINTTTGHLKSLTEMEDYPLFKEYIEFFGKKKIEGSTSIIPDYMVGQLLSQNPKQIFFEYIQKLEKENPNGYGLIVREDKEQVYDICMRNAKVVIANSLTPIEVLDHNISRTIAKSQVTIIDYISNLPEDGALVDFKCDGMNYSLD